MRFCISIGSSHRRKIVAKNWFANGGELTVKGKIEMTQQSEYEVTNVEVNLKGLVETSGYHIHVAPVEGELGKKNNFFIMILLISINFL